MELLPRCCLAAGDPGGARVGAAASRASLAGSPDVYSMGKFGTAASRASLGGPSEVYFVDKFGAAASRASLRGSSDVYFMDECCTAALRASSGGPSRGLFHGLARRQCRGATSTARCSKEPLKYSRSSLATSWVLA